MNSYLDNTVTVNEISRVTGIDPALIRKWDGYDLDTDTVLLTNEEMQGLWVLANKGRVRQNPNKIARAPRLTESPSRK